jgi:hypothetical protein
MQMISLVDRLSVYLAEAETERAANKCALSTAGDRLTEAEAKIESLHTANDGLVARLVRLEEQARGASDTAANPRPTPMTKANSSPAGALRQWSPKNAELRKRVDAADSALASLRLRSTGFDLRQPAHAAAPNPVDGEGAASPATWESPLKAVIESAAASTGLSVEELLGTAGGFGTAPHTASYPRAMPGRDSHPPISSYSPFQSRSLRAGSNAYPYTGRVDHPHPKSSSTLMSNINSDSDPLVQAAEMAFQQRF